ncbi:MAG: amino acid ABC transporter substrate-binding protein [Azoarcus sp.]|jgi:glutamate/aspartate transport system substrate-binding protein|nr:amino acid ABC transporter substrate-binding protein [Azoarcus sp.]
MQRIQVWAVATTLAFACVFACFLLPGQAVAGDMSSAPAQDTSQEDTLSVFKEEDVFPASKNTLPDAAGASGGLKTLERARQRGTIIIGYRSTNVPFSYQNASHQPTGYAKELCDRVVDTIRREFHMPKLKAVYRVVTAWERIPMLQNGTIDLECGSTTITEERKKFVDFSIAYFISNVRILTRKAYHIQDLDDLKNKTVVFTSGTTAEKVIREKLDVERNNITVLEAKTHPDSFLMIRAGRAAAYAMDDVLLAGLIANSRDPNTYEIVGPPLSSESYAIMMRKGDPLLKATVDKVLTRIIASGEIREIYDRWFIHPIPPSGANMNLPMSAELTQFFAQQTGGGHE